MRRLNRPAIAALLALLLAHAAAFAAPGGPGSKERVAPVGPIEITHVLHFAPEPKGDVAKQASALLDSRFPALKRLAGPDDAAGEPAVRVEVLDMKAEGFEAPSMDMLKYYGRGVSREQAEAMQTSSVAVAVTFTYGAADALATVRQADMLMKELAARTGGLVWDVETRELFTPEALGEKRLGAANGGFPDVRDHITIHAYQSDEYVRAITLGMRKFGLPDVVTDEFAWSLNNRMGNTISLFAQALLEGATPTLGGYDFDVSTLRNSAVRAVYEDNLLDGAKPVALLTLAEAAADEGDPDNRLVELRFDRYVGETVHEQQQKFTSTFFGSVDTVAHIKHNEAIRVASEGARKQLPALRKAFNAGLEPGERILLKAPFERPDGGNEWMWVEVSSWQGDQVRGLLGNEPFDIPDLHAGATVEVSEADVFDYIRYRADGTEEGNETGREIEKLQQEQ